MKLLFRLILLSACVAAVESGLAQTGSQITKAAPISKPVITDAGLVFQFGSTFLKIEVWGENVIRIACATNPVFFARSTPATEVRVKKKASFTLNTKASQPTLTTAKLAV